MKQNLDESSCIQLSQKLPSAGVATGSFNLSLHAREFNLSLHTREFKSHMPNPLDTNGIKYVVCVFDSVFANVVCSPAE